MSLPALFAAQVERTPQAVALVGADDALTYQALDLRSNYLAHQLRALGVGPDVLVGVYLERGLDLVVGLLAVLKARRRLFALRPGLSFSAARLHAVRQWGFVST
jgi:non-ribosomal peptide synthetase component F